MTALQTGWYWVMSQWVMMMESVSPAQSVRGCRWYWWIATQQNWRIQNSRLSLASLLIWDISLGGGETGETGGDWSEDKLIRAGLDCRELEGPRAGSSVRTDYYISVRLTLHCLQELYLLSTHKCREKQGKVRSLENTKPLCLPGW